jgi:hypothetical protein
VQRHTGGSSGAPLRLQSTLMSTYKAFVWAVAATVALYVIGFSVLTDRFMSSSSSCISQQQGKCVTETQDQPCEESEQWATVLQYYEGIWAAAVLVVFTLLAFLFNGVVFAM